MITLKTINYTDYFIYFSIYNFIEFSMMDGVYNREYNKDIDNIIKLDN